MLICCLRGTFGAGTDCTRDWLNKDEEDFGYQSLTAEGTAQQAEDQGSSEEDMEDRKREEKYATFKFPKKKETWTASLGL